MVDSVLQEDDLIPIVKSGKESPVLDYKEPMNWDTLSRNEKAEIIRDMMGLANSEVPGYIVFGAKDDGGVVQSYEGLSEEQYSSFDPSKIADKVKRYASPELSFELYKLEVEENKYVVIRVLPFDTVPIICIRSCGEVLNEAAIYVRGEGARTIKVQSAESMRSLIERAVQINADTLVDRIRKLVGASRTEEKEPEKAFHEQASEIRREMEQLK